MKLPGKRRRVRPEGRVMDALIGDVWAAGVIKKDAEDR